MAVKYSKTKQKLVVGGPVLFNNIAYRAEVLNRTEQDLLSCLVKSTTILNIFSSSLVFNFHEEICRITSG